MTNAICAAFRRSQRVGEEQQSNKNRSIRAECLQPQHEALSFAKLVASTTLETANLHLVPFPQHTSCWILIFTSNLHSWRELPQFPPSTSISIFSTRTAQQISALVPPCPSSLEYKAPYASRQRCAIENPRNRLQCHTCRWTASNPFLPGLVNMKWPFRLSNLLALVYLTRVLHALFFQHTR